MMRSEGEEQGGGGSVVKGEGVFMVCLLVFLNGLHHCGILFHPIVFHPHKCRVSNRNTFQFCRANGGKNNWNAIDSDATSS